MAQGKIADDFRPDEIYRVVLDDEQDPGVFEIKQTHPLSAWGASKPAVSNYLEVGSTFSGRRYAKAATARQVSSYIFNVYGVKTHVEYGQIHWEAI